MAERGGEWEGARQRQRERTASTVETASSARHYMYIFDSGKCFLRAVSMDARQVPENTYRAMRVGRKGSVLHVTEEFVISVTLGWLLSCRIAPVLACRCNVERP